MAESLTECAECTSDDLEITSIREIHPPRAQKGEPDGTAKPAVARTIWVRCRSCGWTGSILRKLGDANTK